MRRAVASTITAGVILILSWAIPYYIEVNNMITPENSYWLLIISIVGIIIVLCVIVWGFWPMRKRIRLQKPIKLVGQTSTSHSKRESVNRANHYSGYVQIGKKPAGANLEVMAKVGDYTSAPVTTNAAGYYHSLEVSPPNDSYIGLPTEFYIEGKKASRTLPYMGGGHRSNVFNLDVNGKDKEVVKPLTEQEIAENLAFIQQLQAVAEKLLKNCQGAESQSITSVLKDITQETHVKEYLANDKNDKLVEQILNLLKCEIDDFTNRVDRNQRQTNKLSTTEISGDDIFSLCNLTNELLLGYRRLINEILKLLDDFWMKGLLISTSPPWSARIHKNLADNYDELMRLVTDLKARTPKAARDLLPKDDQLSKFPRIPLVG